LPFEPNLQYSTDSQNKAGAYELAQGVVALPTFMEDHVLQPEGREVELLLEEDSDCEGERGGGADVERITPWCASHVSRGQAQHGLSSSDLRTLALNPTHVHDSVERSSSDNSRKRRREYAPSELPLIKKFKMKRVLGAQRHLLGKCA
jgi:hypothetical protein